LIPEAEIAILEQQAGSRYEILHGQSDAAQMLDQLVQVATKASMGRDQLDELIAGATSPAAAVRYWSLTGIGNIGTGAQSALPVVRKALEDPSPSVRIAAARAAARLGQLEPALTVLRAELQSEHPWGRLAAAIVLDEMDDQARGAMDALQGALHDQPNKYIVRVANRALNELQGTNHQVP
jgi:uncharacterized sulfatase